MNNLRNHERKDAVKWIIVGVTLLLIIAAIVLGVLSSWYTNWDTSTWFEQTEQTEQVDDDADPTDDTDQTDNTDQSEGTDQSENDGQTEDDQTGNTENDDDHYEGSGEGHGGDSGITVPEL